MSNKFRTAEQIAADKRRIDAEENLQFSVNILDGAKRNLVDARREYIENPRDAVTLASTGNADALISAGGALALAEANHAIRLKEWDESRVRRPRKATQPAEVAQA